MNEFLEQLFHSAKVKEFVALIKKVPEQYETPERFLEDAAAYLSVRLYEHHYEDTVPHSLFGLASALPGTSALFRGGTLAPFRPTGLVCHPGEEADPLGPTQHGIKK